MNKIKNAAARTKKFVQDHKVSIAVVATATPLIALHVRNQKVTNDFLQEHDLLDKFYAPKETTTA